MSEGKRDGQRSGRDAVRQAQLKQAAADRKRKQLVIAGVVAAAVVVLVVIGILVQHNKTSNDTAKRNAYGADMPFAAPSGVSAQPATVQNPGGIVYGPATAKVTLQIWEDVRCPYCKLAEDMFGDTYRQYVTDGKIKVEYHLVDLIDRIGGGQGSLVGGSSLACAQDVGSTQFEAYHNLFYKDQPDESADTYGTVANVLNLAGQVPGLRGAAFDACATDGKYAAWIKANYDALSAKFAGHPGTPDFYIDGTQFTVQDPSQVPEAQQQASLKAALDAAVAEQG